MTELRQVEDYGSVSVTSHMRAQNYRAIVRILRESRDGLTLSELAGASALSRPTIERCLASAVDEGLVEEVEISGLARGSGRPARRFRFRSEAGCVAGIDVGPSKIDIVVADLQGNELARRRVHPSAGEAVDPGFIRTLLVEVLSGAEPMPPLLATTLGVPGIVDSTGEVSESFVLPRWVGCGARGQLEEHTRSPVHLVNDAHLATSLEWSRGAGRGVDNLLVVMVGNRFGSGAIVNGRLLVGAHGGAGEMSLLPEAYWADAQRSLAEVLAERNTDVASLERSEGHLVEFIFEQAARGEAGAQAQVDSLIANVTFPILALVLALDPELVVVGGGVARAGTVLLDPLQRALETSLRRAPFIALADYLDDAVVLGAVDDAMKLVLEQLKIG